ncbi:hypothetical protein [Microbispora sp. NPDC049633]|uniref:hypothetical protein n=1 Tax=Microbispora sp. NPDC049633 TaxID=3154355 RepID=UPI003432DF28
MALLSREGERNLFLCRFPPIVLESAVLMTHPPSVPSPAPQPSPAPVTTRDAPAPRPSPTPQPSPIAAINDGYSGINPASMDEFEKGLGRAEDVMGRNEQVLDRALRRLGLDASGLAAVREMRNWIAATRPDLRRRSATIRAEQTEWAASAAVPGGLSAFDEALYGRAGRDPDVYAAVTALTDAAAGGEVDERTLAALEKRKGDAAFTTALMTTLGAAGFRTLMVQTAEHGGGRKTQRLQAALGSELGTASRRLGDAWRDELTSGFRVGWQDGLAVALALKQGGYDTRFLTAVAGKLDAWDREMAKFPVGSDPGVMRTVMEALSRDPAAAQDFFTGDPTMLKRYLTERGLGDGGTALGKALEAATLTFRDHEGSPQHPSRGYLSAKLTSELVHIEAGRIEAGRPSFLKPVTTGRILAGYISDIDRVAQNRENPMTVGVSGADNPGVPGKDPWGAQFGREELRRVMREAFADSAAFTPVLAAQTAFTSLLLDHGAARMREGDRDTLLTNAERAGAGFGMITDAAGLAKIEAGKELDEAQERNMKIFMAGVNTALVFPKKGGWPITADLIGAWTGIIEDSAKGDAESKARSEANAAVDQSRTLLHDLTAQAMLKHGAFGPAEPPAKTHPWASLEGLEIGDDPRGNPNNFLKDDGRTLMTMDEMTDKTATNSTDKYRRVEAYERWLYDGLSGKPWRDVEDRLDQGFFHAFAQYAA